MIVPATILKRKSIPFPYVARGIHPMEPWRCSGLAFKVYISMFGQCDEGCSQELSKVEEGRKNKRHFCLHAPLMGSVEGHPH